MNSNDSIEVTAPSVDEAVEQALEQLGAAEDDVIIEVLATPRSGVLGLGSRPARVRVRRKPPLAASTGVAEPPAAPLPRPAAQLVEKEPVPAPPRVVEEPAAVKTVQAESAQEEEVPSRARKDVAVEEQAREATAALERILDLMGEKAEVTFVAGEPDSIELRIKSDGSGVLIGRHGQTLDALEYLVNRIVARRIANPLSVVLDSESYRARRRQQLHRTALSMAERAKREHEPVKLEPMPPRDRRIIHLALKDDPLVTTRSSGEGFLRTVEILPVGGQRAKHERPRGNARGRDREQKRQSEGAGEQGGFQHGQKKLF